MIRAALPFACAVLLSMSAAAEVTETSAAGAWTTAEGSARDGTHVCVLSTAWTNTGNGARYFGIKHFAGRKFLILHVGREGWKMPDDSPMPIHLTIDNMGTWDANGFATNNLAEFHIGGDSITHFMHEFTVGNRMVLRFPGLREDAWIASLAGSARAASAFIDGVERHQPAPTGRQHRG